MANYIRTREGNTYFFTVVTWRRQRILCEKTCRRMLRAAIADVRAVHPFTINAWILLPDHMHCIWQLPEGDTNFSKRWGLIKAGFTRRIHKMIRDNGMGINGMLFYAQPSKSQKQRHERLIWQRRFWEHMIRNENDYNNHCDYIHFNPVKHGLVKTPSEWPWPTFHDFVAKGIYSPDWGAKLKRGFLFMSAKSSCFDLNGARCAPYTLNYRFFPGRAPTAHHFP